MEPWATALGALALTGAAVGGGFVLRGVTQRTRSLRHLLLVVTFGSLLVGAVAAVVLARVMVLDAGGARAAVGVLVLTAVFATVLVLVASAPLGRDVARLEATVRGIEAGDRSVRTGLQRADELGQVGRALDELSQRLDELERERAQLDEARRAMFSNIGHDLRTPLSALRVAVEALADGVAPEPERYLRSMQRDVEALSALVDDLFLLARIEGGRLDLAREPLDLTELVDEAVEALTPAAAARARHHHAPCRRSGSGRGQRHRHRTGHPQPPRQRHPPRPDRLDGAGRRDLRGWATERPGARRGPRLPRRLLAPRLRAVRPRRSQP